MIAGHLGVAAASRTSAANAPLWSLILATFWLDVVFAPLLLFGIEEIDEGDSYGDAIIHADYTHSLIGAMALSALLGLIAVRWWGQRAGLVIGIVAFSHWVLDLIVHHPDMPLVPGNLGDLPLLGFGLWGVPAASMAVELLLVVAGTTWYFITTRRRARHAADGSEAGVRKRSALILLTGILLLVFDVLSS